MSRTKLFRRAYLGGTFDCLHRGHLALFTAAHKIAEELVVSVNTDEFTERYKRRPLMPLADRIAVLEQCRLVDQVVINIGDEDSKIAIVAANVDCIVHGDDWQGESLMKQMGFDENWLKENKISIEILPYTRTVSTTAILKAYDTRGEAELLREVDVNTTTCLTCGRAVYRSDVDSDGNCSEHSETWHKPSEEEWKDLGRPA